MINNLNRSYRTHATYLLHSLIIICASFAATRAQGSLTVSIVRSLPATCNAVSNPVRYKLPATSADLTYGFYECDPATSTWAQLQPQVGSLTAKTFIFANATPAIQSTAAPTNGQLLIGSTGNVPALGTPLGTANEILATLGAGTLQYGLAATVIHKAGTNFQFTDTTDTTKKFIFDASGITTATTRTFTLPDSNSTLPIFSQIVTFAGPTAARTYTLPDAATTLAGIATAQTITNKLFTFGGGSTNVFSDSADATKTMTLVLTGITTGTNRAWTVPNSADTFTGIAAAQTLTNKTITMGGGSTNVFSDSADATKTATLGLTNITTGTNRAINVPNAGSTTVQTLTAVDSLVVNAVSGTTGVLATTTVETLLSSTPTVNMNTATATVLYTSPTGRSTIITKVLVSTCSTSMTTASYSFGWEAVTFANVIANATHTELTGATLYTSLGPKVGAVIGTTTGTFGVLMNTLQGGAATCKMDVFGYTF